VGGIKARTESGKKLGGKQSTKFCPQKGVDGVRKKGRKRQMEKRDAIPHLVGSEARKEIS